MKAASPSPFHPGTFIQFAWDSTSLGLFKECARKYYYTIIVGYRKDGESAHLKFGIHYHSGLEFYDKQRALGLDHEQALHATVRKILVDTWDYEYDRAPAEGEPPVAIPGTGAAWESNHPLKTRANLIRSVVWYLEEFKDDAAKTIILANGQPAVELSFRFNVDDNLVLCGHLDRVVSWMDGAYVMDRKTSTTTLSSYYFDQYEPDNQMSLYTLAGRLVYNTPVRGVVIDAAQIAVGFTRFDRGLTYRSEASLDEWLDATRAYVAQAAEMADEYHQRVAASETFPERAFPMNDKSCHKYGGCPFRAYCAKDPQVRKTFLDTDFEIRPWNPLEVR
jgi:hypothetical protein